MQYSGATCLRQTPAVVFCAIDTIVPVRGKSSVGFEEFGAQLDHAGLPCVWLTARCRAQIDEPRRKFGQQHPFTWRGRLRRLPSEDYFHLRPAKTVRLGRYTCIPVAGNTTCRFPGTGIADRRHRSSGSFPAIAGSSGARTEYRPSAPRRRTGPAARLRRAFLLCRSHTSRHRAVRRRGQAPPCGATPAWCALVAGRRCRPKPVYSRPFQALRSALRSHPTVVGIATPAEAEGFLSACDRGLLLAKQPELDSLSATSRGSKNKVPPKLARRLGLVLMAGVTSRA